MKHPRLLRGVAAAAIAGVVSAPALADNSVFKAVVHADLKNIDPIWTTAYISRNHGYMVWDTLFASDEKFEVHPQMAESGTVSEDGNDLHHQASRGAQVARRQPRHPRGLHRVHPALGASATAWASR